MKNRPFVSVFGACVVLSLSACGETSGAVLERIPEHQAADGGDPSTRPGPPLRADVFVVKSVASYALGEPCNRNNDPDNRNDECFELVTDDGYRVGIRADSLEFALPSETDRIEQATQKVPFTLVVDEDELDAIEWSFQDLSERLWDLSKGEIFLDLRFHRIDAVEKGLTRYKGERGFYLPPDALEQQGHSLSRDTDFIMTVTGARDPEQRLTPQVQHCAGTVTDLDDGIAGAGYTWMTTQCLNVNTLVRHWWLQVKAALPANGINDFYANEAYPTCGNAKEDPLNWWPHPDDCSVDPDAPTCNDNHCEGSDDDWVGHVLTAHWRHQRDFFGSHCGDGKRDYDESSVDVGGSCEILDR